ncbi:hypothetical protein GALMADRAFT_1357505 [Galerina marginata CBS 339.88]|uniref:BTB domain-containing protein n=1 Tax=Galerina marginata (strain CBS 339.88) TaxID=685588 RepID=A0A067TLH9_GALM3|nr:hypothetical protein GALMADRAFT_1357505 [Galerina marginata CBS 339.88]
MITAMDDSTEAGVPFNSTAQADVVLRSSDGVKFYAIEAFLSFSSSFFQSMFSLPKPNCNTDKKCNKSLPVVEMAETSGVIMALLQFCYPGIAPERHLSSRTQR